MGSQDSTIVMRTGYMVPVDSTKTKSLPQIDSGQFLEKLKQQVKKNEPVSYDKPFERDEYRRMPDGSLQKVRVKFTPATEEEKQDLWNKWMNKIK